MLGIEASYATDRTKPEVLTAEASMSPPSVNIFTP